MKNKLYFGFVFSLIYACTDRRGGDIFEYTKTRQKITNTTNLKVEIFVWEAGKKIDDYIIKPNDTYITEHTTASSGSNNPYYFYRCDSVIILFDDGKYKIDTANYNSPNFNLTKNINSIKYYSIKKLEVNFDEIEYTIDSLDYAEAHD